MVQNNSSLIVTHTIINIAAYKFAPLANLAELRVELRELTKAHQLRGTILLSTEGINLFVAGSREGIDALLARVRQVPGLADLPVKESESGEQPFSRMLVKIKREIIAFGVEGIDPARYTSPRVTPAELKRWLDGERNVTLLDTRNDYEIAAGTFENAVTMPLDDFRNFPEAVTNLPEALKDRPIVTFCTGGIRCEKAAPYLEQAGFKHVFQLDGGILKYFEDVGGAHYRGECFVFDKRVAVDPKLTPSDLRQCFACQAILSPDDCQSPTYVEGRSCPHCFQTPAEALTSLIERTSQGDSSSDHSAAGQHALREHSPVECPRAIRWARIAGVSGRDANVSLRRRVARRGFRRPAHSPRSTDSPRRSRASGRSFVARDASNRRARRRDRRSRCCTKTMRSSS